ncbi:GNAT family N-acetyltransferase [Pontibacter sp. JH31]|uniref:GNAT family N-acetyltransferase n=1 Tax=Pontibacter aquaedesilientis TaxID=2766980 RepID=A0ABR7XFW9_9BACT|nr:GNAT family N-acetyltransferase [Pontibacter aquaedesilientis]MBD1397172.1 GNAT family N-acetyltransferase [Pontibacter aquaedesilientis]
MSTYKSFETERLLLKPTTEEDAPLILALLNSPKWLQYIGDRNVRSEADARSYIQTRMIPQLQRLGYSNYTVIRKSDREKMGVCGLYDREGLEGIDIGFAFMPEYEQKGYAFEAASEIKRAALEVFGITRISAITSRGNTASQKLLEKLGLTFSKMVQIPNDKEELMLYEFTIG